MHFKLDENLDPRWKKILTESGHSASTVREEKLDGASDQTVAAICRSLGMALITVDLDFAQTAVYPPSEYSGLIVLRHPQPTLKGMSYLIRQIVEMLKRESPKKHLWIVEPGRIRIHE